MLEWRIFTYKQEVIRYGKKEHKDDLHNLYSSPNINYSDQIKEDEMGDSCCMHERDGKWVCHFSQLTRKKETIWKT
jgi:hypothetical protein